MLKTEKPLEVREIRELASSHKVIGILNMHKLPTKQLQQIRESLRGKATIRMSKKTVMKRSLEGKKELHGRLDGIKMEPALLFSNENPFRLYKILKDSRTPAAAKPGDIAPKDIIIQQGPTSLPPGPAISTLQKVGLKANVQGGKIAVLQDKVVCKAGEAVSEDLASVLNLLKIEPMEIGLDLVAAYEEGVIYGKDVLDIDQSKYISNLQAAVHQAVNLSLNTGYITKFTAEIAIQKVFMEARSLAIETDTMEKDFIDDVLAKAIRQAKALEGKVGPLGDGKNIADASESDQQDNKEVKHTEENNAQ